MERAPVASVVFAVLVCLVAGQGDVRAQSPVEAESPRVEALTIRGARAIGADVLRDSLATQETRCRGLLLRPLCWISGSPYWTEYHRLDRAELARDELRIRVIYFRAGYREAQVSTALTPEGDGVEVTFTITEGPPTRVAQLSVRQADSVLSARQVRGARLPAAGDLLDLNRLKIKFV